MPDEYVYATESMDASLVESMDAITKAYYAYTLARGTNDGIPPYSFKWDTYKVCEDAGILRITTARLDNKLVGFTLYIVMPALHHNDLVMADCDTIMLHPDTQGKGVGKALLQYSELVLRTDGAHIMVNRYRTRVGVKPMFEDMGFTLWETAYMKRIN